MSLYSYLSKTESDGNVIWGGPSLCRNNRNCFVYTSDKDKLVAVRGLDNYIVVDTGDILMICPRDEHQAKDIIANMAMPEFEKFR